ncbi:MAG: DUF3015 family protein [Leptospiraceae bacterium]|nr:DUF3015 family protein [Leptospiraceae bacterium]MCP5495152.1 DUF3015 family protein [Leptospiraceae bacterium]
MKKKQNGVSDSGFYMKRLIVFFLFCHSVVFSIEKPYGMAGCGLGATIIKDKKTMHQFLASFFNWHYFFSSNQSSAITTGTSNCVTDGIVKKEKEQEIFVHINYESLEKEMACGKGEKLNTLANLFGCQIDQKKFNVMVKTNYRKIFFKQNNTPKNIVNSIQTEINNNDYLSETCKN